MELWIIIGVCAAVFAMVIAVAGAYNLIPGGMPEPERTGEGTPGARLPEDFQADDIGRLAFTRELRGYNMTQVDAALAALRQRIEELEQRPADVDAGLPVPDGTESAPDVDGQARAADPADVPGGDGTDGTERTLDVPGPGNADDTARQPAADDRHG